MSAGQLSLSGSIASSKDCVDPPFHKPFLAVLVKTEAIDRMYLNVYVPHQTVGGMLGYLRVHRGQRFASTMAVARR